MSRTAELVLRMRAHGTVNLFLSDLSDIYYLSGFTGTTAYMFVSDEKALFITDGRYAEQAAAQIDPALELVIVSDYAKTFAELAGKVNVMTVQMSCPLRLYRSFFDHCADVRMDTEEHIKDMRMRKTPEELAMIREQYNVIAKALAAGLESFAYGETESAWAARLEYEMKLAGARGPSFETIVASGVRSSLPHGTASAKIVEKGDPVTIDFGSKLNYCSDITRVVYDGSDPDMQKIIWVVYDALHLAADAVRPGRTCREIDRVARKHIEEMGYGAYFNHGLGHGVGIDVHEAPAFNTRDETVLEPGMVLTIEPGIYLPGRFGARLEDTVAVTENGCEFLSAVVEKHVFNIADREN